jgi:hypothetical protein
MKTEPQTSDVISIWCPLSQEELQMVEEMAAVGFSAEKICLVLQRKKRLFLRDYKTEGTPVNSAYNRGLMMAQMETDNVTLENAKKGNLTAKQQMEKKWEEQRIENIKNELFNT